MKGLIFTYLMTYGGAAASLFRPFVGLLVYLSFAILKPNFLWAFSVPRGNYSRTVFIALFIGWALHGFGHWRLGTARAIVIALGVYFLWTFLSAVGAPDQALAWTIVWETLKIVLGVIVGLSFIDSVQRVAQIAWVLVLSLGYLAFEFNMSYYQGDNALVLVGFATMDDKSVAINMVTGAGLAVFLAMASSRLVLKAVAFAAAALMVHVPLFTFSRGGMLALLAAGAVALIVVPKKPIQLAVVAVVILLGFRLAGPEVRRQFFTTFADAEARDDSAEHRILLWGQASDTIAKHPVFGIGPRHWLRWSVTEHGWKAPKEVHNTWIQTAAEIGLPGACGLVLFFLLTGVRVWKIRNSGPPGSPEQIYARMILVSLAGFAAASQFITVYGLEMPYFVAMLGAGLLKLSSAQPAAAPAGVPAQPHVAAPFGAK